MWRSMMLRRDCNEADAVYPINLALAYASGPGVNCAKRLAIL
jgi:hypothetical protein